MTVDSIITRQPYTIDENDPIEKAEQLLRKHRIRHLPVTKDGKLTGIISLTDIQRLSFGDTYGIDESEVDASVYSMLVIKQIMKAKPVTISPKNTVKQAAEIFIEREFHALPVVENNELIGIITSTDLIKLLIAEF